MKQYLKHDPWKIIEEGFDPSLNRISESVFSIGNGRFGQRANFEEAYSGDSLQGSYVAGVYYPDKTKVGWWKNGYPEYFAKVLNAPNWIGIHVDVDGLPLDLAQGQVLDFYRELNMQKGYLERRFTLRMPSGKTVQVASKRFCSVADDEWGAIRYSIKPLDFSSTMTITPYVDADIENEDSNYDEKFWDELGKEVDFYEGYVNAATKKTDFHVCTGMKFDILQGGRPVTENPYRLQKEKYVGCAVELQAREGEEIVVYKYASVVSSLNYAKESLVDACRSSLARAYEMGYDEMLARQEAAWQEKWQEADIVIEGDVAAQQGIRFNIFQLYQTYTGEDERLNIGPKGFTGEKYGGSTYWDTEAYCFPFYLATADPHVARNLLVYRYKHLEKAIENAAKLGFTDGAALFPMVTINGEECHNEWEITFEEIHRNGAIAYAIYDYIRYNDDPRYLIDHGLELLIGVARFWAQRIHFSQHRQQYVMHGVTGPNEYENNVNNNWYTNYIAVWCMQYAMEALEYVKQEAPDKWEALTEKIKFYEYTETNHWKEICANMFFPYDEERGIFLQQEGFLDKEIIPVSDLAPEHRPLNQKWSWDRILRSCYIKQADVLQGIYLFEDHFDEDTIRRNFDFYEPLTVHESSLSPCVHAILASKLGKEEKAYEMYLRTARLDLDDYNNDTEDGCHITSMAGTWMAFVKGFGGMRVYDNILHFNPYIPARWTKYAFNIRFRGHFVEVKVDQQQVAITNRHEAPLKMQVYGEIREIPANQSLIITRS